MSFCLFQSYFRENISQQDELMSHISNKSSLKIGVEWFSLLFLYIYKFQELGKQQKE